MILALILAIIAPPYTSWGKEAGGLQAGLGFESGHQRAYAPGETVKLIVRVRNVGKEKVSFQYLRHYFIENPPTVMNDLGEPLAFKDGTTLEPYKVMEAIVEPGKELELYELSITLAEKAATEPRGSMLYGEGKFQFRYGRILGNSILTSVGIKYDPALEALATGKLELEVKKGANPK